jgi:hypothetical protein
MQLSLLELQPFLVEDMPITETRFNKLVERVSAIGERLAKVEG